MRKMKDKRAIEFGKRLRHVRLLLKLKQKEFAERIGMANNYLSEIESGNVKPGFEFFYKASKAFNINAFYLLHGEGPVFRPKKGQPGADGVNKPKSAEWQFVENDAQVLELIKKMKDSIIVYLSVLEFFNKYILENNELILKDISRSKEKPPAKEE
ncbi:MAG: helix-turn-helix domain-containing protein [Candidatus Aminicenantes bacterium]|nr:helix-turn-helix domain-containing protein [Candidatus Aminicenantes bacterium]